MACRLRPGYMLAFVDIHQRFGTVLLATSTGVLLEILRSRQYSCLVLRQLMECVAC